MCNHELNIIRVKFHFSYESLSNRWRCGEIAVCVKGQRTRYFSTGRGGFILVSDYLLMQVTLVGASWVMVAGEQMWTFLARPRMKKDPVSLSACGGEYVKNMITKRRFPREELSDC